MEGFNAFPFGNSAGEMRYLTPTNASTVSCASAASHVWRKPRGAKLILIVFWGSAGGAGGGFSGALGTIRGGGGGGGSAFGVIFLTPAWMLPDYLHIVLGRGGLGGNAATIGLQGARSAIMWPTTGQNAATTTELDSINGGGGGGAGISGSASGGAVASAGGSSILLRGMSLFNGTFNTLASTAGGNGGNTLQGTGGTNTSGSPFWSGSGGSGTGGTNVDNSGVTAPTNSPWVNYPAPAGGIATTAPNGVNGYLLREVFASWPGGAGASSGTGTGGIGGDGGPGSGGSGGGGGITGGAGGKGGDAGCIITPI